MSRFTYEPGTTMDVLVSYGYAPDNDHDIEHSPQEWGTYDGRYVKGLGKTFDTSAMIEEDEDELYKTWSKSYPRGGILILDIDL